MHLQLYLQHPQGHNAAFDDLYIANTLHHIARSIATVRFPSETYLEMLIPSSLRVPDSESDISLASAKLYLALHPLITDTERFIAAHITNMPSARIAHIIAKSACVIINHYTRMDHKHMIVSIWLTAERIFEAGLVSAFSIINQKKLSRVGEPNNYTATYNDKLQPIFLVTNLLASFSRRWKAGLVYIETWNAIAGIVVKML